MNILKFFKDKITFDNDDVNSKNISSSNIENEMFKVKLDIEIETKFIDNRNGYYNNESEKLLYKIENVTLKLNPLFLREYSYYHRGIGYNIKFNFINNIIEFISPYTSPPEVYIDIRDGIFIICKKFDYLVEMIKMDKSVIEEKLSNEYIQQYKYTNTILSKLDFDGKYKVKI